MTPGKPRLRFDSRGWWVVQDWKASRPYPLAWYVHWGQPAPKDVVVLIGPYETWEELRVSSALPSSFLPK